MDNVFASPVFSVTLCLSCYIFSVWFLKKIKVKILPPFVLSIALLIISLLVLGISSETYSAGGDIIDFFLVPATVCLAIPMYKQLATIKKNLYPVLIGTSVGALTAILSVYGLCKIFNIEEQITLSLLAKSVTTPIAVDVADMMGGIAVLAILGVFITGIFVTTFAPQLVKLFKLKNKVAIGLALGCSGHGSATSRALEMGEVEGALSSIAIGLMGIFTVIELMILSLFLF